MLWSSGAAAAQLRRAFYQHHHHDHHAWARPPWAFAAFATARRASPPPPPPQVLDVPPETEIPVPFDQLVESLQRELSDACAPAAAAPHGSGASGRAAGGGGGEAGNAAAAALGRVSRHLENISQWRSLRLGKRLKASFAAACAEAAAEESAAAAGAAAAAAAGGAWPGQQQQGQQQPPGGSTAEQVFLSDFYGLLRQARYQLLTKQQWAVAQADSFTFDIPVRIRMDGLDARWLRAFWAGGAARAAERAALPDLSDHILVFHRGIGMARARGRCVHEKVDLLVQYGLWDPLIAAAARAQRRVARWRAHSSGAERGGGGGGGGGGQEAAAGEGGTEWAGGGGGGGGGLFDSSHKRSIAVERRMLRTVLPDGRAVLRSLFAEIELQEPTFKDVVVLYKRAPPRPESPAAALLAALRSAFSPLSAGGGGGGPRDAPIFIKSFQDIPLADSELCFPDKTVHLKPFVLVRLLAAAAGAAAAGWLAWSQGGSRLTQGLAMSLATLLGGRATSLLTTVFYHRARMAGEMERMQYNHARDTREGFLAKLLDDMAAQSAKEDAAAYGLLLAAAARAARGARGAVQGSKPAAAWLGREALDDACEEFLEARLGVGVDFILDDSLARLMEWGLVVERRGGGGGGGGGGEGGGIGGGEQGSGGGSGAGVAQYAAVPLEEAERRLEEVWRRLHAE
ncbi:MAG: hypothetical protein J3K34DRAFT_456690 [Monoraphidium minutum]|nr:MAG: hypothetical protein J3K34DRAFT_456690 [Monoraphidium minutum]